MTNFLRNPPRLISDFITAIVIFAIFFLLIFIAYFLHKRFNWESENSRKFLHVSGGSLALASFPFLRSHWAVLVLCAGAFLILVITFMKKWLPAIHQTKRVSFGSILFPIPIYVCFFVSRELDKAILFYLPVALLTISDTMAEIGGTKWGHQSLIFFTGQKTLIGSASFASSSFIISFCLLQFFYPELKPIHSIVFSLILMVVSTVSELLTLKGFDNLTVPLATLIILYMITESGMFLSAI